MILGELARQLKPKGRAFRFPKGGNADGVLAVTSEAIQTCITSVYSILDTILPDNPNFSEADASIWEKRLGLLQGTDLETRKKAIMRKLNSPGQCKGRLSLIYLQGQLQAAGFDVYVHENKFSDGMGGYVVNNPGDGTGSYTQHGLGVHGVSTHGATGFPYNSIVANFDKKELEEPAIFTDSQLRATFFIGGQTFPNFASVPANREREFRKLILTLKGQHLIAYLLINYV